LLSLPIIGGMISQNLLNLVDTAMVGQLGAVMVGQLGAVALATVGIRSFAMYMSQSILLGLSTGAQAIATNRGIYFY